MRRKIGNIQQYVGNYSQNHGFALPDCSNTAEQYEK